MPPTIRSPPSLAAGGARPSPPKPLYWGGITGEGIGPREHMLGDEGFRVQVGPAPAPPKLPQTKKTTGFCCTAAVPLNPFPRRR